MADEKDVAEELARAADEVVPDDDSPTEKEAKKSDVSGEEEPEEKLPDEPEDNAERSQLGRRVKAMEDNQAEFFNRMENLLQGKVSQPQKETVEDEEFDEDYIPTTKGELDKWADARDRNKEKKRQLYEDTYRAQLNTFAKNEDYSEIVDEMMANHNFKRSDDGGADALINYQAAEVALLRSKAKERKSPLNKNKDKQGEHLGGAIESENMDRDVVKPVKLDPEAAEFARSENMSDEEIQKALSVEPPASLFGGKSPL
jgi:hypothetical protein